MHIDFFRVYNCFLLIRIMIFFIHIIDFVIHIIDHRQQLYRLQQENIMTQVSIAGLHMIQNQQAVRLTILE